MARTSSGLPRRLYAAELKMVVIAVIAAFRVDVLAARSSSSSSSGRRKSEKKNNNDRREKKKTRCTSRRSARINSVRFS